MKALLYRIRIPLVEWYFVAACCYFGMMSLNLNVITLAVIIGFVNTYLVIPIARALDESAEEPQEGKMPETGKNVLKSMVVCALIMGVYYLINAYWFEAFVEAYSFGLLYWIFDQILSKIFKKWK